MPPARRDELLRGSPSDLTTGVNERSSHSIGLEPAQADLKRSLVFTPADDTSERALPAGRLQPRQLEPQAETPDRPPSLLQQAVDSIR